MKAGENGICCVLIEGDRAVAMLRDETGLRPWSVVEVVNGEEVSRRTFAFELSAQCCYDLVSGFSREALIGAHMLIRDIDRGDSGGILAPRQARRLASVVIALDEESTRLNGENADLRAQVAQFQRACDEGLPRELIFCPNCQRQHVDGPRHDNPKVDGSRRPHRHHRCEHCGYDWESGRWSFGVCDPLDVRAGR